jgi:hypothetical protein
VISERGKGVCVVNSMQIETVTVWDFRQGKWAFVLLRSFILILELNAISDWRIWVLCYLQHAN